MISVKIIKDSMAPNGKRLTTFELEYPRFIHAELLTHRALSKNSSSSRSQPVKFMIQQVWNNMAMPMHWGRMQAGMQAHKELIGWQLSVAKFLWILSGKVICVFAWLLLQCKLHKQIANRIMEPWSHIKIVLSGTDFDNFFHLRNHPDAQPEIHELARQMWQLYQFSGPQHLKLGEWHLPYISHFYDETGKINYYSCSYEDDRKMLTLEQAKQLSASLCAQVSYRKSDQSLDKALKIYQRLVESKPVHASPFEHQGTPLENSTDRSGNFCGWRQMRQDIPDNVCVNYEGPN